MHAILKDDISSFGDSDNKTILQLLAGIEILLNKYLARINELLVSDRAAEFEKEVNHL